MVDGTTGTVMTRMPTRMGGWSASLIIVRIGNELYVHKDRYCTHEHRSITVDEMHELILKHVQMCE